MMVVALFFSFALLPSVGHTTEVTFENCMPGTWVGGVKWEWKDGVRGNYEGSTYKDIPELDLKNVGSLVVDLEPGDYAITHYRPVYSGPDRSGKRIIFIPAAVLDFREIKVSTFNATYSFGCEE
jgi:hypothetical protein